METTITARHGEVPDDLKVRAAEVLERLAARTTRPTSARVTFDTGKAGASAEIMLKAARGTTHVAKADAEDHRTALDQALAKLQRQLDKADTAPTHRAARKAGAS